MSIVQNPASSNVNNNVNNVHVNIGGYGRRRQSFTVHLILFMTTCGVGNYFYARSVSKSNRRRSY